MTRWASMNECAVVAVAILVIVTTLVSIFVKGTEWESSKDRWVDLALDWEERYGE